MVPFPHSVLLIPMRSSNELTKIKDDNSGLKSQTLRTEVVFWKAVSVSSSPSSALSFPWGIVHHRTGDEWKTSQLLVFFRESLWTLHSKMYPSVTMVTGISKHEGVPTSAELTQSGISLCLICAWFVWSVCVFILSLTAPGTRLQAWQFCCSCALDTSEKSCLHLGSNLLLWHKGSGTSGCSLYCSSPGWSPPTHNGSSWCL